MATGHNLKIIQPFLPSLSHLSAVQVAIQLYEEFDYFALKAAYERIEKGTRMALIGFREFSMWIETKKAKEKLLFIPWHLRKKVMESVQGLRVGILDFQANHKDVREFIDTKFINWRPDGTIDRVKTVNNIILNANIDIKKRFELACIYCLEDSIKALWKEIKESGKIESIELIDNPAVWFWVHWIREESLVPWRQAAAEFVHYFPSYFKHFKCISLFSSLPPKQRKKVFRKKYLGYTSNHHFLQCLLVTTKEEEEQILKWGSTKVLTVCKMWPHRTLFLETAEMVMKFINSFEFSIFLEVFFLTKMFWKDFDYYEHFVGLWNMTPIFFREDAKQNPYVRKDIFSCFKEIKRNRKAYKIKRRYSRIL